MHPIDATPRVEVDEDSCTAAGVCVRIAPTVFRVVDDRTAVVDQAAAAEVPAQVLKLAVDSCPWSALSLE